MSDEWSPEDFDVDGPPRRRGLGVRVVALLVLVGLVVGLAGGVLRLFL